MKYNVLVKIDNYYWLRAKTFATINIFTFVYKKLTFLFQKTYKPQFKTDGKIRDHHLTMRLWTINPTMPTTRQGERGLKYQPRTQINLNHSSTQNAMQGYTQ